MQLVAYHEKSRGLDTQNIQPMGSFLLVLQMIQRKGNYVKLFEWSDLLLNNVCVLCVMGIYQKQGETKTFYRTMEEN